MENMWILVLILSIKLQMPTWYWVILTIYSIAIMPIWAVIKYLFLKGFTERIKHK